MRTDTNLIEGKMVLVVDDNDDVCKSLSLGLKCQGAKVLTASNGAAAVEAFYQHDLDLVILDGQMPIMDGWEATRRIRYTSNIPIIMFSSANQKQKILEGYTLGVDDYIIKPCTLDILFARIGALLRRCMMYKLFQSKQYDDGYLYVDWDRDDVYVDGNEVRLTSIEQRILCFLCMHAGQPLSYSAILRAVWGSGCQDNIHYVQIYISRLRTKIEENPKKPFYLVTEYGYGYRFRGTTDTLH